MPKKYTYASAVGLWIIVCVLGYNLGPLLFNLPVMLSYWIWMGLVLVLCATPFCVFTIRDMRKMQTANRQRNNLCPTCRYDLRAHSPGQTCPECGTPIPAP